VGDKRKHSVSDKAKRHGLGVEGETKFLGYGYGVKEAKIC